jgi:tetratricopeptide (TPR) repeat protein
VGDSENTPASVKANATPPQSAEPAPVNAALARYQQALDGFEPTPRYLLAVLSARDHIDTELRQTTRPTNNGQAPRETYRLRLQQLLEKIDRDHPSYVDLLLYQHRLIDNLDQWQRYGDTETLRAERARVVEQLNNLALAALGVPFIALEAASPASNETERISEQLVALDQRLRQQAFRHPRILATIAPWRDSLIPPDAAWWWKLDQQFEQHAHDNDLPWYILAGACLLVTVTFAVEIIRRFWAGGPDFWVSTVTLLTVLLTGSPLLKQSQDLAQWSLRRIPNLSPRYRGELSAGLAGLALLLVGLLWFSLPQIGRWENNWGRQAINAGDLVEAERRLERAAALAPDLPVSYYNLAQVYLDSGRDDEAIRWLERSIERDRRFRPAYYSLGYIYNRRGDYEQAEPVLVAGLDRIENPTELQADQKRADYELLANLGWAYFGQGRMLRAREAFEDAVALEAELGQGERLPFPHYFLARIYCQPGLPGFGSSGAQDDAAKTEWTEALRYLNKDRWEHKDWYDEVATRVEAMRNGASPCDNGSS